MEISFFAGFEESLYAFGCIFGRIKKLVLPN